MARIARKNRIRVHLTITTLDERLARLIEPRAPRPALRLAAVKKLTEAGVPVSVLAHPVMPLINDSEESLDRVCAAAARNGASSFSAAPLFLEALRGAESSCRFSKSAFRTWSAAIASVLRKPRISRATIPK